LRSKRISSREDHVRRRRKRDDEIEYALNSDIFSINAESSQELQVISLVALRLGKKARISLRVNPDIDAQSHPYITPA